MELTSKLTKLGNHKESRDSATLLTINDGVRESLVLVREGSEVRDISNEIEYPGETVHDDVIISPCFLEFKDASEGQIFRERFTIRNTGKNPAFIRICEPNSLAFSTKTLKRGEILSPGLALKRWVTYSFKRPALLHALIPIEINGYAIDYRIVCSFSTEYVQVSPSSIDFGTIDIGCSSGPRQLTISNAGGKSTRMTIDTGKNELEVNVKPHRGIVRPRSSLQIHAEIIGTKEGVFFSEFWIKSTPNIRVPIKVNVIIPRLIINYPNTSRDFTLIDFSNTFVGTRRLDSLILENGSSKFSSFVVLAEIGNKLVPVEEVDHLKNPEFRFFEIHPAEGRLESFDNTVFSFSFIPSVEIFRDISKSSQKQDFIIFLRIVRVHCTEVEDTLRSEKKVEPKLNEPSLQKVQIKDGSASKSPSSFFSRIPIGNRNFEVVRLCLHGEAEVPQLRFDPNQLHLQMLDVNDTTSQFIWIKNLSERLPITVHYVKCGFASCEPTVIRLEPENSTRATIEIIGGKNRQIVSPFDLIFDVFIDSITPFPETQKIHIKTMTISIKCFLEIRNPKIRKPRMKFTLSKSVKKDKFFCHSLEIEKYQPVTLESLWLTEEKKMRKSISSTLARQLSPLQIYNIKVSPTILSFGPVAIKVSNYQTLTFKNENEFPVTICLKSLSPRTIKFPVGDRIILKPDTSETKIIEFHCDQIGKFNSYVDYIINGSHTFELAITANVVHKYLKLELHELIFGRSFLPQESYQPITGQVELKNPLNATTSFKWHIPPSSGYSVEPRAGSVRGRRSLFVNIRYEPDFLCSTSDEAVLVCEGGLQSTLKLKSIMPAPKVAFLNDSINVGEIALNVSKKVFGVLHNAGSHLVFFQVDQSKITYGCEVYPLRGYIHPRGIALLHIVLKFEACLDFAVNLSVTVQNSVRLGLKITGQVPFPKLTFSPTCIEMSRIQASQIQTNMLTVVNQGKTLISLRFLLDDYPEFSVSTSPDFDPDLPTKIIEIPAETSKSLFLHFKPADLANYKFYLPIVINDILGPVIDGDPVSWKPKAFLKDHEEFYLQDKGIKFLQVPSKLSGIFISCTVIGKSLSFNKICFKFDLQTNEVEERLEIRNNLHHEVTVSLGINQETRDCGFSIKWLQGGSPDLHDSCVINCTLLCDEHARFKIRFDPIQRGFFKAELPVFLQDESSEQLFSGIQLEGQYHMPEIDADESEIYFIPVTPNKYSENKIILRLKNFDKGSKILVNVEQPDKLCGTFSSDVLMITFPHGNAVGSYSNQNERAESMEVRLGFHSAELVSFRTKLRFSDEDNQIHFFVRVHAICDISLLTVHEFSSDCDDQFRGNEASMAEVQHQMNRTVCSPRSSISLIGIHHPEMDMSRSYSHLDGLRARLSVPSTISPPKYPSTSKINLRVLSTQMDDETQTSITEQSTSSNLTYPFFPLHPRKEYDLHLRRALTAVENWIYSVPLKFQFYPDIVDGVTFVLSGHCNTKKSDGDKTKNNSVNITFPDVLEILFGLDLTNQLKIASLPDDDTERINLVLEIYEKMLDFLNTRGAFLSHVSALLLLNYDDYSKIHSSEMTTMTPHLFEARSKQCWLDVFLQTYKVHIYSVVNLDALKNTFENMEGIAKSIMKKSAGKNCCKREGILLAWLEHHYEHGRLESWLQDFRVEQYSLEQKDILPKKSFNNFEADLSDSLGLIIVTASYCPFLIAEYFMNIYLCPKNSEETLHNAICVVNAWERIRLGFIITAEEIIHPNSVQMLMLVTHLFQTLSVYMPKSTLKFSCPLSESEIREIHYYNSTGQVVNLIFLFFGNSLGFFSLTHTETILRVKPRETKSINVKYQARKIQTTLGYLLICASAIGPNLSRSQCYKLEGTVSQIKILNDYKIKGKLYRTVDKVLTIEVPYPFKTNYDIWMTENMPSDPEKLKIYHWLELAMKKVPRHVFINQTFLAVLENSSKANLSITLGCISPGIKKLWLVFQSAPGDFVVQLTSSCQVSSNGSIEVTWERKKCVCHPSKAVDTCPLRISLGISSKNIHLWNCISQMVQKSLDPGERIFWSKMLEKDVGIKVLEWMVKNNEDTLTNDFKYIFEKKVDYQVSLADQHFEIIVPEIFSISDVHSENEKLLQLHIPESMPQVFQTLLTLNSTDKRERRIHEITFSCNS